MGRLVASGVFVNWTPPRPGAGGTDGEVLRGVHRAHAGGVDLVISVGFWRDAPLLLIGLVAVLIFFLCYVLGIVIFNRLTRRSVPQNVEPSEHQSSPAQNRPSTGMLFEGGRNQRASGNRNMGYERGMHAKDVDGFEAEDNQNVRDMPPDEERDAPDEGRGR